jgi:hypothetical protein
LNADQEQRERIQEFRAIEFHLKDVLGVTTTESQNIEREKREDEFNKILGNSSAFTRIYVTKERVFPGEILDGINPYRV